MATKTESLEVLAVAQSGYADGTSNHVFVNSNDYNILKKNLGTRLLSENAKLLRDAFPEHIYLKLEKGVYIVSPSKDVINAGTVALNRVQRTKNEFVELNKKLPITPFDPQTSNFFLSNLALTVDYAPGYKKQPDESFAIGDITEKFKQQALGNIIYSDQLVAIRVREIPLWCRATQLSYIDLSAIRKATNKKSDEPSKPSSHGLILDSTTLDITKAANFPLVLGETPNSSKLNFDTSNWNFDDIGVGGLSKEVGEIFRRAFLPRLLPADVRKRMNAPLVRGIMLYGPPGTGKTLIARQISQRLTGREPIRISGPEIFHWLVGKAEDNIRKLFEAAELDQKNLGDKSPLHMIVFDEMDSIAKKRGMRNDSTGVADNVVNQLLSKMDGNTPLNNILIIGTTNRLDLIDEAILRPRRFEVHVEVNIPDEKGRKEIFLIHTKAMRESHMLSPSVNLDYYAAKTKNFTGAEIEGLVGEAQSFAISRKMGDITSNIAEALKEKCENLTVEPEDMERALMKTVPAFGSDNMEFDNLLKEPLIAHGSEFVELEKELDVIMTQLKNSSKTPFISVLLHGQRGVGKSTLLAHVAQKTGFPFAKLVSAQSLLTKAVDDFGKCTQLMHVFNNAYHSENSVLVIDDLERIVEYVAVGPKYSPGLLQTMAVLLEKKPPEGRKLLIVATCTDYKLIQALGLASIFHYTFEVPTVKEISRISSIISSKGFSEPEVEQVANPQVIPSAGVPIKKLLLAIENASFVGEDQRVPKLKKLLQ